MELQRFAAMTGGQAFFPDSVKELDKMYEKIQREIAARYSLGYTSTDKRMDGAWRKVKIRLKRKRAQGRQAAHPRRLLRAPQRSKRSSLTAPTAAGGDGSVPAQSAMPRTTTRFTVRRRLPSVVRCFRSPWPPKYDQFKLVTDFELRGDQARAIDELVEGLNRGDQAQVLLGVTGSGKTFTMAQCIARVNRPTLVMAHNKTLAAQLYQEFRRFFPENAVEYFVSYYDYYQPEAYVPTTDSYIEKEATINDEIDRMRLSATRSLFERRDVIIVASVSCIYGLGSPEAYYGMMLPLERGQRIDREQILRKLVEIQYERNDHEFNRGVFRVRGDIVEVYPSYEDTAVRIELFGDEVDELVVVRSADRQDHPAARQGRDLPEDALRHVARPDQGGGREHQGGAELVSRRSSSRKARCSRRTACTSGRCSTSR